MEVSTHFFADLILQGGTIITMDPSMPRATALAIAGSRILRVGHQRDVDPLKDKNTKIIDLKGCYVYPGFIETHMHVLYTGITQSYLQLHKCSKKSSVLAEVAGHTKTSQKGEWIIGTGWDDSSWPDKHHHHAQELDNVAPDNPVILVRKDTHLLWANSYALKLAGIDKNTLAPAGGKIEKDASGHPTGIMIDKAMFLVLDVMPALDKQHCLQVIQQILHQCLQLGITTIHNAATNDLDLEAFKHLALANELKVRLYLMGTIRDKEDHFFLDLGVQAYHPFLQLRCLKLWMDGALGSHGAALFEPYQDNPSSDGLLLWNEDDFLSILKKAKAKNFQVATHAIGDRANHLVLDAYEKVGVTGLRWRIEHAQQLLPSDIKRFSQLGVIAAMQPLHATEDMKWLENRLGRKRIELGAFLWRSLLDNGTMIVGGSDAPVVNMNPLWGIHAAMTRQDHYQNPKDGWYPEQRITSEEALKMYTIDAAYSCFQEHELGSIVQGKLADLVVLPENLLNCAPEALIEMKVICTIVDGEIVFDSGTFVDR